MILGVVGGPPTSIKWGGLNLPPVEDAKPEYETSPAKFTANLAGDGSPYSNRAGKTPYFKCDIVVNPALFDELVKLQDGVYRAGSVTLANGDVLTLNCILEGEVKNADGKVSVNLAGKVTKQ
jgi:hypothetical protein